MHWDKIKKIHFVGIKGVGMAPLAVIAKEGGFIVSGSDVSEDFITKSALDEAGISDISTFSKENVIGKDLVVITAAHGGYENAEALCAKEKDIPILTQSQLLGVFQDGSAFGKSFQGICIAGSHGKTTTTAMVATILSDQRLDPSYSIGTGEVPTLAGPGHLGKGKYFVCEADEYVSYDGPKFLTLKPKILVITNIDFDHPDVYKSISDVEKAFLDFTNRIDPDGILIACGDGAVNEKFLKSYGGKKITYGTSLNNDYVLEKVSYKEGKTFFWVKYKDSYIGEFSIDIFGEQNALDGLAAILAGMEVGLSIPKIKESLSKFRGSKRRSEFIGTLASGALLYDDYAHHPLEISETLKAFKKNFPKHQIIPIFQPHMYSRTQLLFDDFVRAFDNCDRVIVAEVFPSFREKKDPNFSSKLLSDAINKRVNNKSNFLPTLADVVKYLSLESFSENVILITMGAGDIYKIHNQILS